jgi:hypothetical protein
MHAISRDRDMADGEPMRIGRLARRTGVSVKALRFYDS